MNGAALPGPATLQKVTSAQFYSVISCVYLREQVSGDTFTDSGKQDATRTTATSTQSRENRLFNQPSMMSSNQSQSDQRQTLMVFQCLTSFNQTHDHPATGSAVQATPGGRSENDLSLTKTLSNHGDQGEGNHHITLTEVSGEKKTKLVCLFTVVFTLVCFGCQSLVNFVVTFNLI